MSFPAPVSPRLKVVTSDGHMTREFFNLLQNIRTIVVGDVGSGVLNPEDLEALIYAATAHSPEQEEFLPGIPIHREDDDLPAIHVHQNEDALPAIHPQQEQDGYPLYAWSGAVAALQQSIEDLQAQIDALDARVTALEP